MLTSGQTHATGHNRYGSKQRRDDNRAMKQGPGHIPSTKVWLCSRMEAAVQEVASRILLCGARLVPTLVLSSRNDYRALGGTVMIRSGM